MWPTFSLSNLHSVHTVSPLYIPILCKCILRTQSLVNKSRGSLELHSAHSGPPKLNSNLLWESPPRHPSLQVFFLNPPTGRCIPDTRHQTHKYPYCWAKFYKLRRRSLFSQPMCLFISLYTLVYWYPVQSYPIFQASRIWSPIEGFNFPELRFFRHFQI